MITAKGFDLHKEQITVLGYVLEFAQTKLRTVQAYFQHNLYLFKDWEQ